MPFFCSQVSASICRRASMRLGNVKKDGYSLGEKTIHIHNVAIKMNNENPMSAEHNDWYVSDGLLIMGRRSPRTRAMLSLVVHANAHYANFKTFDISAGGISFFSKQRFNPFSKISASLTFPLPNANNELNYFKTISIMGTVVRVDDDFLGRTKARPYLIAMALISIDPLDQLKLNRFVQCLLKTSRLTVTTY